MENEFDSFAQNYRGIHNKSLEKLSEYGSDYFCKYKIEAVVGECKNTPINILDFGCGDGVACQMFSELYRESNIVGVDVSEKSIQEARIKNIKNCHFSVLEQDQMDSLDYRFDLIFCSCVFHHIEPAERLKILEQLFCKLKEDGKFFIFEHNPNNPLTLKAVRDCVFDKNAILVKASQMRKMLEESGFKRIKLRYTLFIPRFKVFRKLFFIDKFLGQLPIGAQYYFVAQK